MNEPEGGDAPVVGQGLGQLIAETLVSEAADAKGESDNGAGPERERPLARSAKERPECGSEENRESNQGTRDEGARRRALGRATDDLDERAFHGVVLAHHRWLLYGVKQYLRYLIPSSAKPGLKRWLGFPDLDSALDRLSRAGFRPAAIVDIGAFIGDWTLMSRRHFPDARVLMVEPQPDRAAALQAVAGRLKDVTFASALLGAAAAPSVTFFQNTTVSSVLQEADNTSSAVPLTLPMTTLDAVLTETGFGRPDFLKLDVQGYELEVLKGAPNALAAAEVVLLEVNLIPINRGAPLLAETVAFMAARGFRVYDICSEIRRPLDNALWQTDMLFARESSPLVASTRWI